MAPTIGAERDPDGVVWVQFSSLKEIRSGTDAAGPAGPTVTRISIFQAGSVAVYRECSWSLSGRCDSGENADGGEEKEDERLCLFIISANLKPLIVACYYYGTHHELRELETRLRGQIMRAGPLLAAVSWDIAACDVAEKLRISGWSHRGCLDDCMRPLAKLPLGLVKDRWSAHYILERRFFFVLTHSIKPHRPLPTNFAGYQGLTSNEAAYATVFTVPHGPLQDIPATKIWRDCVVGPLTGPSATVALISGMFLGKRTQTLIVYQDYGGTVKARGGTNSFP
ncbi:hypothetical protein EI94DRAFT_1788986 [Lactarius quietus]|nr:hypothetical protein EI94DRAFT_1788986 [Lactarius quietus]